MTRRLLRVAPLLILGIAALTLMVTTPKFFTVRTLGNIVTLASIVGVLAVGQAFVLITGGFDLAQGAMLGLTAAVSARLAVEAGWGGIAAGITAVVVGAGLGSINGLAVAAARVNPFVATLSTRLIFSGATFVLLAGEPVTNVRAFAALDRSPFGGEGAILPGRAYVFVVVAVFAGLIAAATVIGRHARAVGGNLAAARLSGLRTTRVRVAAFAASGAASGLSAVLLLSWLRLAKADTGANYELDAIAACVIGGVSLQGGSGSPWGAALGAVLLQTLATLLTMRGLPDQYRALAVGGVILAFAVADATARRRD